MDLNVIHSFVVGGTVLSAADLENVARHAGQITGWVLLNGLISGIVARMRGRSFLLWLLLGSLLTFVGGVLILVLLPEVDRRPRLSTRRVAPRPRTQARRRRPAAEVLDDFDEEDPVGSASASAPRAWGTYIVRTSRGDQGPFTPDQLARFVDQGKIEISRDVYESESGLCVSLEDVLRP